MPQTSRQYKAFTLVEIILYLSIASLIMMVIVGLMASLIQIRNRNIVVSEVDEAGMQISQEFYNLMNGASAIQSPAIGSSAATLTLTMYDSAVSPSTLALNGSNLRLTQIAQQYRLNSNRVTVSNLQFINAAQPATKGAIQFKFTITYLNGGPAANNYTRIFTISAYVH